MSTVFDPELSSREGCTLSAVPYLALTAPGRGGGRGDDTVHRLHAGPGGPTAGKEEP